MDIGTGADPHDEAEFELPDGEAMIQQFLAGLAKEVDNEYRGLSSLLANLPVPIGGAQPEALSAAEARSTASSRREAATGLQNAGQHVAYV